MWTLKQTHIGDGPKEGRNRIRIQFGCQVENYIFAFVHSTLNSGQLKISLANYDYGSSNNKHQVHPLRAL